MEFRTAVAIFAGLLSLLAYIPYARDVLRGKVRPNRSTRLMFVFLLGIALLQQRSLGAGLTLAITIGELTGALVMLVLSVRRGIGGLSRVDQACYLLLVINLAVWFMSGSALLALYLSIVADFIAFFPTLRKTWLDRRSETPLFFAVGALAALLNLAAGPRLTFAITLYPLWLVLINGVEVLIIMRRPRPMPSIL